MNKDQQYTLYRCPVHGILSEREAEEATPSIDDIFYCAITSRGGYEVGGLRVDCDEKLEEITLVDINHDTCPVLRRAEAAWTHKYERPGRHEYNKGEMIAISFRDGSHPTGRYRITDIMDNTGELLLEKIEG